MPMWHVLDTIIDGTLLAAGQAMELDLSELRFLWSYYTFVPSEETKQKPPFRGQSFWLPRAAVTPSNSQLFLYARSLIPIPSRAPSAPWRYFHWSSLLPLRTHNASSSLGGIELTRPTEHRSFSQSFYFLGTRPTTLHRFHTQQSPCPFGTPHLSVSCLAQGLT